MCLGHHLQQIVWDSTACKALRALQRDWPARRSEEVQSHGAKCGPKLQRTTATAAVITQLAEVKRNNHINAATTRTRRMTRTATTTTTTNTRTNIIYYTFTNIMRRRNSPPTHTETHRHTKKNICDKLQQWYARMPRRAKIESPSRPQPHHTPSLQSRFRLRSSVDSAKFYFWSLQRSLDMRDKDALQAVLEDARCEAHFEDMVIWLGWLQKLLSWVMLSHSLKLRLLTADNCHIYGSGSSLMLVPQPPSGSSLQRSWYKSASPWSRRGPGFVLNELCEIPTQIHIL